MKITILSDKSSWINAYLYPWISALRSGQIVQWKHSHKEVDGGDLLFLLSYGRIVNKKILGLYKNCLVVHESELPKGKGWSPLTWQILEGKNIIPVTLFEAVEDLDAGNIYFQEYIEFEGHELVDELRKEQAGMTIKLCQKFIDLYPEIFNEAYEQSGDETVYRKRSPDDSRLDLNKTLKEQFNLFRVVDNKKYPAFFDYQGHRYFINVYKESANQ